MITGKFLSAEYHKTNWFEPGGWQELMMVGAAVKLDIFTTLADRSLDSNGLATSLGLDQRATQILTNSLADCGYLVRNGSVFALSSAARERLGDPKAPEYIGWAVLHSRRLVERWLTLPDVMKSGQPVPGDRFSESNEGFVRAMDVYVAPTAKGIVKLCLEHNAGAGSVLDIGAATGTVSKVFAEYGLSVTLFDTPATISVIEDEVTTSHPAISLAGGDFNEALPAGPFDIVFLGNITHIYGGDKNKALFKRAAAELSPGGIIAILDFVRDRSVSASFFGINMLVNTESGGTWTEREYSDWLVEAAFSKPEFLDLKGRDQQLILARKT